MNNRGRRLVYFYHKMWNRPFIMNIIQCNYNSDQWSHVLPADSYMRSDWQFCCECNLVWMLLCFFNAELPNWWCWTMYIWKIPQKHLFIQGLSQKSSNHKGPQFWQKSVKCKMFMVCTTTLDTNHSWNRTSCFWEIVRTSYVTNWQTDEQTDR